MNEGSGRPNLVNDIVKEMQSGMNPVMGGGGVDQMGGPNPMMGGAGGGAGGHNPMMGGGAGGYNPMMGGGAGGHNPMMGGGAGGYNPMMGGGAGGHNPMMGNMQHGGMASLPPGMSPGLADPMGNSSGDPILGYDGGAAYPDPRGEYLVGQGPSSIGPGGQEGRPGCTTYMSEDYDEDDYEPQQESLDLTTLGTGREEEGEESFIDDVLEAGRDPVIVAILFALLSSPQFNAIFNQMVPRVGDNILYNLGGRALLMAVLYFAVKYFMS